MKPGDAIVVRVSRKHAGRRGIVRKLKGTVLLVELLGNEGEPPHVLWIRRNNVEAQSRGLQATELPAGHMGRMVPAP